MIRPLRVLRKRFRRLFGRQSEAARRHAETRKTLSKLGARVDELGAALEEHRRESRILYSALALRQPGPAERLAAKGHRLAPLDFDPGSGSADTYFDVPPYRQEPCLKIALMGYPTTSFGLIVQKAL